MEERMPATGVNTKRQTMWFTAAALGAVMAMTGLASPAKAEGVPLDNAGIRSMVTGKRIYLATPMGGELPLYYRANGRVDGTGEAIGLGKYLKPKDSGRWWVANNRLCQKWQEWYDGRTFCFKLNRISNTKVYWMRDDGRSGIARVGR
jgi:hypothetical protein